MGKPVRPIESMTEDRLRQLGHRVGRAVSAVLPAGSVFVVLYTDAGGPGVAQYVGNADRSDMVKFLRETADRLERREVTPRVPFPEEPADG